MRNVLLFVLCLTLAGCGSGGRVPIRGQVKFKDGSDVSALAGYQVTMQIEKESSTGEIKPDGTFTMTTTAENDGVLPGMHQIAVNPPTNSNPDVLPPAPVIPKKYFEFGTSELGREIKPGQGNVVLELERAK